MKGSNRPRNCAPVLTLAAVALALAIAWPVSNATAVEIPGDGAAIPVQPGGNGQPTATPTPVPTATPVIPLQPTDTRPDAPDPGDNEGKLQQPTATRTSGGGSGGTPTPTPDLTEHERIKALALNRIVFHDATPVQLCRVEDGLQVYFIGRDGKTRLGPWVPSFRELAELHPEGEEASIYLGYNPLTGKRVKIDYLPHVNRIRVDTFYADRDNDKNKLYIFHFGPEHDIVWDEW